MAGHNVPFMISLHRAVRVALTVGMVGTLLLASDALGASKTAKGSPKKAISVTKSQATSKVGAGKRTKKASAKKRRYRKEPFRRRLARLKLQPERVQEIQRALVTAGYLNQEPNGKWDDATRNAMRQFQQDHGFPTTGLPEAKSLMKLGLGPHPLPEDLDPTARAQPLSGPLENPSDAASPFTSPAASIPPH